MDFLIEERYLNNFTSFLDVSGRAAGTDENIFILKALRTATDHVRFLIMLETKFGSKNLHEFAL